MGNVFPGLQWEQWAHSVEWIAIQRLLLSALLGAIIGWEREHANKQAGLRTHMLVTLGSCLLMLLSIYGFRDWIDHPNARFDPARLAAQVINGIGFLAAGAILVRPDLVVSGLTTAATVWIAMAIGLAVGAGEYVMAIFSTIIVLLVLRVMLKLQLGKRTRGMLYVRVQDRPGVLEEIAERLGRSLVRIQHVVAEDEQKLEMMVQVNRSKSVMSLIEKVRQVDGVTAVYWEGRPVAVRDEEEEPDEDD